MSQDVNDRLPPTPIAIIGMGCMFPQARDLDQYWSNILNRVDAVTDVPPSHWRPEDYFDPDPKSPDRTYATRGGFLSPVDFPPLEFGITPNALEAIDTTQLLGLMVAREALEDAGYGPGFPAKKFDRDRVSVILGVTGTLELVIPLGARLGHPIWRRALKEAGVPDSVADDVVQRIADSYVGWQEDSFPGLLGNVTAGRIANRLNLGGTNCVVDAACASSLSALNLAMLELASNRCDMALTGGLDTFNDIFMYMCFSKTPALSPTGDARPFDLKADGTILGEGLGIVVLKRLADAERDGDKIYAVIKAIGSSSDGKGNAIYAPSPAGQAKALRQTYRLANISPNTVELVEAHGTGTKAGDAAEITALTEVYQEKANSDNPWCALGSVKSQIGHTKAAAGAAGLIKTALALHHKVLPPTIKVDQPIVGDSEPLYINAEKRPWLSNSAHPRRAAVSSFGFGGSNFHCLLEEYRPEKADITWDGNVQILAFSAEARKPLSDALTAFAASLPTTCLGTAGEWQQLGYLAACRRAEFRVDHAERLLMVIERRKTDLTRLIAHGRSLLEKPARPDSQNTWSTPDGIFFGSGVPLGKLAFMFPGQGSQYVGMLRDLACQFPQMQEALSEANQAWMLSNQDHFPEYGATHPSEPSPFRSGSSRLSDFIYPRPEFTEEGRARNQDLLRKTAIAQPAMGAVSRGALLILQHFGIQAEAVAGHSYGELVALHAAGRFDAKTLCSLSMLRGSLMGATANGSDAGAMLAVLASLELLQRILEDESLDLVIANKNAPEQFVLSGASSEIERAIGILKNKKVDHKLLPVSAAFHSRFVAGAGQPLLEALRKTSWMPSRISVFSNTTAAEYPNDSDEARELLAGQLAQPVEFLPMVENLYRAGIRTFVEVGPSNKLTGLIAGILRDRDHRALALDSSSGKQSGSFDLARVLASLAAFGHRVHLSKWDDGVRKSTQKKPTLTFPTCGANFVKPKARGEIAQNGIMIMPASNAASKVVGDKSAEENSTSADRREEIASAETNRKEQVEHQTSLRTANPADIQRTVDIGSPPNVTTTNAFKATQENLLALQRLAEQTAQVHRQFLEGQDKALQAFQALFRQQQALLSNDSIRTLGDSGDGRVLTAAPDDSPQIISKSPILDNRPPRAAQSSPADKGEEQTRPTPDPAATKDKRAAFQAVLMDVIAEKTGYPVEMLELEMELDSDLGIDSIKRVEIFSAIQERVPQAPAVKSEHLGTLRTLGQVVDFLTSAQEISEPKFEIRYPQVVQPEPSEIGTSDFGVPVSDLETVLLQVIAEKTGYPVEMLQLDMEMDADLGIDSIKRVEIFSALQEELPEAPLVKSEQLGSLRTLRQVVDFLSGPNSTENSSKQKLTPLAAHKPSKQLSPVADGLTQTTNGFHSSLTEQPHSPKLRRHVLKAKPLSTGFLQKPLSFGNNREFWITDEGEGLAVRVAQLLEKRGFRPRLVSVQDQASISPPDRLAGLMVLSPAQESLDRFNQDAFELLKTAMPGLRQAGKAGGSILVTVSRMDGAFGLVNAKNSASGGLAGLAKTAAKEWSEVHCKALDVSADWSDLDLAAEAIVERSLTEGPIEIGLTAHGPMTLQLSEAPFTLGSGQTGSVSGSPVVSVSGQTGGLPFDGIKPGDVVVITGGARGITAETALALARTLDLTLVLLGRTREPQPEPDWLASLSGEREIKQGILAHGRGARSPRELEEQYRSIVIGREIRRNLQRIQETASRVYYRSLDIRDESAVRATMAEIQSQLGPVRGLVHGAGVLEDRLIEDKTTEQFESVYSTKVIGLQVLLRSLDPQELKLLALFSSVTARFGRAGQVDYAVANEVLNKFAQEEARRRPNCRVISFNWGPWDGGMVTPALKKFFADEGIGLIPPQTGAEFFLREIGQTSDQDVEIVVLAGPPALSEPDGMLNQRSAPPSTMTLAFERPLDVRQYPFLASHVIDGKAVLPLAMSMEWLAHAALHSNPGLVFHGLDNVRVLHGLILEQDQSCTIRVLAGKPAAEGPFTRVSVELRSRKEIGRKGLSETDTLHVRGEVVLTARLPEPDVQASEIPLHPYPRDTEEIYGQILFHGSDLQGIEAVQGYSKRGILGIVGGAPAPAAWIDRPLRNTWLTDPLVIDSAFQLMVLWTFESMGSASLPCFVGSYRQYRRSMPSDGVRVVVEVKEAIEHRAKADVLFLDSEGIVVARMENYESVIDAGLNQSFRRNRLSQPAVTGST